MYNKKIIENGQVSARNRRSYFLKGLYTLTMPRPVSPQVWLSENAFVSMVSAAVEAFDLETIGVVLGLRDLRWRRIVVQYAIVY